MINVQVAMSFNVIDDQVSLAEQINNSFDSSMINVQVGMSFDVIDDHDQQLL